LIARPRRLFNVPYTGRPAELADVGRLARRLLNRVVETARTEDKPLRHLLIRLYRSR